jgi:hypothetical protein
LRGFWRILKYEEVYLKTYETPLETRESMAPYIPVVHTKGGIVVWMDVALMR